jgi:hypothetical protein
MWKTNPNPNPSIHIYIHIYVYICFQTYINVFPNMELLEKTKGGGKEEKNEGQKCKTGHVKERKIARGVG